jgi:hypothetical protein
MDTNSQLSFLGDRSLWSEDVKWLAEQHVWKVLGPWSQRLRWAHLYLEPQVENSEHALARIQIDLAGHQLLSVVAQGRCPQAAVCTAFTLLLREIERSELVAV